MKLQTSETNAFSNTSIGVIRKITNFERLLAETLRSERCKVVVSRLDSKSARFVNLGEISSNAENCAYSRYRRLRYSQNEPARFGFAFIHKGKVQKNHGLKNFSISLQVSDYPFVIFTRIKTSK